MIDPDIEQDTLVLRLVGETIVSARLTISRFSACPHLSLEFASGLTGRVEGIPNIGDDGIWLSLSAHGGGDAA